jgi:hypothetical protein
VTRDQTRTAQLIFREINERVAEITVQYDESRSEFRVRVWTERLHGSPRARTRRIPNDQGECDYFIAATGHRVDGVDQVAESRDGFDVLVQV